MTPGQHLMRAEHLLNVAENYTEGKGGPWITNNLMAALCHALIAHAAEAGIPHPVNPLEGGGPGAYPLDPRL